MSTSTTTDPDRRAFLTGTSLFLAAAGIQPQAAIANAPREDGRTSGGSIPVYMPLDGYVSTLHVKSGQQVKTGDTIADTESPELKRAMLQVKTAIALLENNANFMQGEYMACVKALMTITANTNTKYSEIATQMADEADLGVQAGIIGFVENKVRHLAAVRAAGEKSRSDQSLAIFDPEFAQMKFRLNTVRQALQDEMAMVQDLQNRMKLSSPADGAILLASGPGSYLPKGGLVAYVIL